MEWISFAAAAVTALLSFLGVYFSNRKSAALVEYRLSELEKKVDKHNNVIDRTYKLEGQTALQDAELKRVNNRLTELEKGA